MIVLVLNWTRCLWLVLSIVQIVTGTCTKPSLPANSIGLTADKTSYAVNDKFSIVCLPSYTISGEGDLICQSSGSWSPSAPSCNTSGLEYPWYALLIGVISLIILIPCILPRIIFACCKKKDKKDEDDDEEAEYHGNSDGQGLWRGGKKQQPVTPITDNGKHRLDKMDIMNMYYGNSNNNYGNAKF